MAFISSFSKGVSSSSTALKCGAAVVVSVGTVGLVLTSFDALTDGAEGSELVAYQDPEEDEGDVEEVSVQQDSAEGFLDGLKLDRWDGLVEGLFGSSDDESRFKLQKELMTDVNELLLTENFGAWSWEDAQYYVENWRGEGEWREWLDAPHADLTTKDIVPAVVDDEVVLLHTEVQVFLNPDRLTDGTIPKLTTIDRYGGRTLFGLGHYELRADWDTGYLTLGGVEDMGDDEQVYYYKVPNTKKIEYTVIDVNTDDFTPSLLTEDGTKIPVSLMDLTGPEASDGKSGTLQYLMDRLLLREERRVSLVSPVK